jgi:hypothetical protein
MIIYKTNQTNKISAFTKPNHSMIKMLTILIKSPQNLLKKINARELLRALASQGKGRL